MSENVRMAQLVDPQTPLRSDLLARSVAQTAAIALLEAAMLGAESWAYAVCAYVLGLCLCAAEETVLAPLIALSGAVMPGSEAQRCLMMLAESDSPWRPARTVALAVVPAAERAHSSSYYATLPACPEVWLLRSEWTGLTEEMTGIAASTAVSSKLHPTGRR